MKLREQFGENSFDAVYAIEATCHAPDWEGIYSEIKHVLKPGGKVSETDLHTKPAAVLTFLASYTSSVWSLRMVHD